MSHAHSMGANFASTEGNFTIKMNNQLQSVEEYSPTAENMSNLGKSECDFDIIERVEDNADQSAIGGVTTDQDFNDNSFF